MRRGWYWNICMHKRCIILIIRSNLGNSTTQCRNNFPKWRFVHIQPIGIIYDMYAFRCQHSFESYWSHDSWCAFLNASFSAKMLIQLMLFLHGIVHVGPMDIIKHVQKSNWMDIIKHGQESNWGSDDPDSKINSPVVQEGERNQTTNLFTNDTHRKTHIEFLVNRGCVLWKKCTLLKSIVELHSSPKFHKHLHGTTARCGVDFVSRKSCNPLFLLTPPLTTPVRLLIFALLSCYTSYLPCSFLMHVHMCRVGGGG